MKLTHIRAENFLGIRSADVALTHPVTLFAGENYAGKSSLQEAVRMALTGEPVRVHLKKEYGALVHEGQKAGHAAVTLADGAEAVITLPGGKTSSGYTPPAALPYVLDAQRFARLDEKERRSFLFGLMGLKTDLPGVQKRLIDRGCDAVKVEKVLPLLRAGFEAAHKDAKDKATEAKGAWRALTGETYGSEKAKTWKAAKPAVDQTAHDAAVQAVRKCDADIEQAAQQLGALKADKQRHDQQQARVAGLQAKAALLERALAKLAKDEEELAKWEAELAKVATNAGTAPRTGLVHDLAKSVYYLLQAWPVNHDDKTLAADDALRAYEAEYGDVLAVGGDPEARARLPEVQRSRDLMAAAVANDKRDVADAERAAADLKAITEDAAEPPKQSAIDEAEQRLAKLKTGRTDLAAALEKHAAAARAAAEADAKTQKAAAHHADVLAWDAIASALAPDGIPSEILVEALEPINTRLTQASLDADWLRIGINRDMSITCRDRPYELLSESEKWRADAMLAEAISHISGLRVLVLDRFDVLDLKGRMDLLAWMDVLAQQGEIETALLFGTLKSLPPDLPATVGAEWIDRGRVGHLKAAA